MARIDQLIAAMNEHSASALSVAEGQRPSLNIAGTEHTVTKQVLDAAQVTGLLIEIAPDESRSAIRTGLGTSFVYSGAGDPVQVEISPGPRAVLKPIAEGTADPPAAASTVDSPTTTPVADPPAGAPTSIRPFPRGRLMSRRSMDR